MAILGLVGPRVPRALSRSHPRPLCIGRTVMGLTMVASRVPNPHPEYLHQHPWPGVNIVPLPYLSIQNSVFNSLCNYWGKQFFSTHYTFKEYRLVLPTGMPVPAFARPLAKNPMPAMPVARKFSTGKCPQCPLPECEKRACPRAKTGIKFSRKCDDFPLKNRKKCLFSLHEIATYIFWLFSSKFRNFWLFSAKIMNF